MKSNYDVNLKIPEDVLKKLLFVCNAENRSLNNQLLLLSRNAIAYFERTKGKIDPKKLSDLDLSEFIEK